MNIWQWRSCPWPTWYVLNKWTTSWTRRTSSQRSIIPSSWTCKYMPSIISTSVIVRNFRVSVNHAMPCMSWCLSNTSRLMRHVYRVSLFWRHHNNTVYHWNIVGRLIKRAWVHVTHVNYGSAKRRHWANVINYFCFPRNVPYFNELERFELFSSFLCFTCSW